MNTNYASKWMIRAFLMIFVILVVFPILFVLVTSLKTTSEFYQNVWALPKSPAWENYIYAWKTAKIGEYFLTSVITVCSVVICTLLIGALAGYALARMNLPGADILVLVIFLLSMLPSESILMPAYLIISKMRLTGTYASLIIPYISWYLPLCIYIYRNFFATVPQEIIEAARIDGCQEFRIFTRIMLPVVRPATITNAIFIFLGCWGEMLWASVELSSSALKTLPLGITAFVQSSGTDWGPLCAATSIILIPVVVFFFVAQKYMISGLTGGAVKG